MGNIHIYSKGSEISVETSINPSSLFPNKMYAFKIWDFFKKPRSFQTHCDQYLIWFLDYNLIFYNVKNI